jgi:hypothetical protein
MVRYKCVQPMAIKQMIITIDVDIFSTNTHTPDFHTMRFKGRDSASGIGRKLSIIRPGATTVVAP